MGGDELRELLGIFALDAPRRLAAIERELDVLERSPAGAATAALEAHSLLGAAATLRLEPLAALAERLELTLREEGAARATRARDLLAAIAVELDGLDAEPQPAGPTPATTPAETARNTVLHVEDNPVNVKLVERVLARRPQVRLLTATRADAGLQLARSERPELVLLDLNLPDASGREFLTRLREDPVTSATPVVVVTADADPARTAPLSALGVRECLTKPVDVARLLELVDEVST
jgi:CheY-like chemotaxis protein